jgi:hypothetical protein
VLTRALAAAETTFRKSAMWAYAINQSRAKVVMDPIYMAVARRILPARTPLSPKLAAETFAWNLYLAYSTSSRTGTGARRGPSSSRRDSVR